MWFIIVVCHVVGIPRVVVWESFMWLAHSPCVVGIPPCVVNPSPVCGGSFARVWLSIRPCVVEHSPWEEENGPFSVRLTLPTRFTTMLDA